MKILTQRASYNEHFTSLHNQRILILHVEKTKLLTKKFLIDVMRIGWNSWGMIQKERDSFCIKLSDFLRSDECLYLAEEELHSIINLMRTIQSALLRWIKKLSFCSCLTCANQVGFKRIMKSKHLSMQDANISAPK